MSELSCQVKAPAEFSDEELKDFTAFVLAGGGWRTPMRWPSCAPDEA